MDARFLPLAERVASLGETYISVAVKPYKPKTVLLDVRQEHIDGVDETIYHIAIAKAPEKGKANKELVHYLEEESGKTWKVSIIAGASSSKKLLKITSLV